MGEAGEGVLRLGSGEVTPVRVEAWAHLPAVREMSKVRVSCGGRVGIRDIIIMLVSLGLSLGMSLRLMRLVPCRVLLCAMLFHALPCFALLALLALPAW